MKNIQQVKEKNMKEQRTRKFLPVEGTVRKLGRTKELEEALWLVYSGTGAEFIFRGKQLTITIKGDSTIEEESMTQARMGIYVNNQRVVDDLIDQRVKKYKVWNSSEPTEIVVRVVKLSEASRSMAAIGPLETDGEGEISPGPKGRRLIEFVGDSITCGYGVDDEVKEHIFATSTEDVTKTYAYKTAEALDADYSMVCISGYGIISGYTDCGVKQPEMTIPQYYEKLGYSHGTYGEGYCAQEQSWDFTKEQPDAIVINLGTNDNSYVLGKTDRQEDYVTNYLEFLKVVRQNNPDAEILCVLGIMGEELCPCVKQVVESFRAEQHDTHIYYMGFQDQDPADGYVVDWHPTECTHRKAASRLTEKLKNIMNW